MLYAEYRCFAQFLRYWAFCPLHIYLQVRTTQAPKNKDKAIWVTVLVGMVIVHVTFTWRIKRAKEACYLTTIICVYMCLFSTTMLYLQWYIVTYFTFIKKKKLHLLWFWYHTTVILIIFGLIVQPRHEKPSHCSSIKC